MERGNISQMYFISNHRSFLRTMGISAKLGLCLRGAAQNTKMMRLLRLLLLVMEGWDDDLGWLKRFRGKFLGKLPITINESRAICSDVPIITNEQCNALWHGDCYETDLPLDWLLQYVQLEKKTSICCWWLIWPKRKWCKKLKNDWNSY